MANKSLKTISNLNIFKKNNLKYKYKDYLINSLYLYIIYSNLYYICLMN